MIFTFLKQRKEKRELKYIDYMTSKVKEASDKELMEIHKEYHYGIAIDRDMGCEIRPYIYKIDDIIEYEVHKRNLKTFSDIEEENYVKSHSRIK